MKMNVTMCLMEFVKRTLQSFRKIEGARITKKKKKINSDDLVCEHNMTCKSTTSRQPDGTQIVRLSFKLNPPLLWFSKVQTLYRLWKFKKKKNTHTKNFIRKKID